LQEKWAAHIAPPILVCCKDCGIYWIVNVVLVITPSQVQPPAVTFAVVAV
jgi:hypothetical protein